LVRRKLNKLGTFNLSQLGKSKSPIAEFMRNARKNNDNFEESLLKLVSPLLFDYLKQTSVQNM
jgi:magnesium chelatase subunit H